jgi:NAD+ diphosphatase
VRYLASTLAVLSSLRCPREALSEEITVDPQELAEARWFSHDEIREMVARAAAGPDDPTRVSLPPPLAIAHQLCRRWSSELDGV